MNCRETTKPGSGIRTWECEIPDYVQQAISEALERGRRDAREDEARRKSLPWWKRWFS